MCVCVCVRARACARSVGDDHECKLHARVGWAHGWVSHICDEELVAWVAFEVLVTLDVDPTYPVSFLLQPLHQMSALRSGSQCV
jgi:hypothetical protein